MRLTAALTFVGLVLTATPGMAAPILGSGSWQSGHTAQENLGTFWDGNSWDSTSTPDGAGFNPCNAGSLVAGSPCGLNTAAIGVAERAGLSASVFNMATPGGAFEYWGTEGGGADLNYAYQETGGAWYDFALVGEFTDDWAINEFGFYDVNDPNNRTAIFSASQTVGALSSVYIPGDFGFYYRNTSGNGEMFFTQTMLNGLSGDKQQFASFQLGDTNFVGIEDIFSHTITQAWTPTSADYDYNDVMIGFERRDVPEPGTMLLMGLGLVGAASRLRRKNRI